MDATRTNAAKGIQTNIYVASLPPTGFTKSDLRRLFEPFGRVVGVHLMREKSTGQNTGCGFVCYERPEDAQLATEQTLFIRGKKLQVRFASRHLYFKSAECDTPFQPITDQHLYIKNAAQPVALPPGFVLGGPGGQAVAMVPMCIPANMTVAPVQIPLAPMVSPPMIPAIDPHSAPFITIPAIAPGATIFEYPARSHHDKTSSVYPQQFDGADFAHVR